MMISENQLNNKIWGLGIPETGEFDSFELPFFFIPSWLFSDAVSVETTALKLLL